jgi:hypothetical protein
VSNRVSRRQAGRWAEQDQQQEAAAQPVYAEPEPAAPAGDDMSNKLAQLEQLGKLKEQGVLSDAEFEVQKGRILNP